MAASAAVGAFRRTWSNPEEALVEQSGLTRASHYRLLYSYFDNSAYEALATWASYKARHALYRYARSLYNPTRRLVEFYAGAVYPGVLSEDGGALPDGMPQAIPLASDTAPELRAAIAQWWQWANWQAEKAVYVRFGAITGNVLVEIDDDIERGKVRASVRWPGLVSALDLDGAGNVKRYALEYRVPDGNGGTYTYRREVDSEAIRTYRDGRPADLTGNGAAWDNPYGFVPAVWVRHSHVGGDFGSPAIDGSLGKIDELNSLASHVHDQVHKKINAPALLPGVSNLSLLAGTSKRGSTSGADEYGSAATLTDREDMLLIGAPAGADVKSLAGTFDVADAAPLMDRLITEIEADHPELTLYREMRGMSQVTGPGAQRLLGDAAARVYEAAASYDRGSVALMQMAVAIGGERANSGAWGPARSLTRQQQRYLPFDLVSYERGELDFAILPRPLVVPTQTERWTDAGMRASAVKSLVEAGYPLALAVQTVDRTSDDEVSDWEDRRVEAIRRDQLLATEDVVPVVGQ